MVLERQYNNGMLKQQTPGAYIRNDRFLIRIISLLGEASSCTSLNQKDSDNELEYTRLD